jgi:hypothetical protein
MSVRRQKPVESQYSPYTYALTVRIPDDGTARLGRQQYGLMDMRSELAAVAKALDSLVVGESVTIERIG